jgi:CIC family chloride channel protein
VLYALLGALMGLAATAFIKGLSIAEDIFENIKNGYLRHIVGMLIIGTMMYVLLITAGQYYVDGVGYATIQAILSGSIVLPALLALLFLAKLCATSVSLGSGASGGIFSPSLFMGATLGGAFGAAINAIHVVQGLGITTCAMVGMAAMVGGGTGAAMTAVTMIFEMTRDYDLVMPIIVAVALAIGVRRLLSQENIYTVKLVERKHFVPKALHANMFLIRRAGEVMERDVTLLPKDIRLETFLRQGGHEGRMKHIVVSDGDRIVGVLRVNTALRRGIEDVEQQGFTLGEIAQRNYTVAREEDIVFDVVTRMTRHNAGTAVVSKAKRRPRIADVLGVITKEHIADSVAHSIKPYGE